MNESKAWEAKLERLLRRSEKVVTELMKSKLSRQDKIWLLDSYRSFTTGLITDVEKKYPSLRKK